MRTRAAVYLRVSKEEQTTDNQCPDVLQLAEARGFDIVERYDEHASAAKQRPAFDAMMSDARRGDFRVLLVWALDRFGRSMQGNINALLELDRLGVQVVSVREPWLDTGGPVRSLLVAIFSWVAEQERARLVERTMAGLDRARRQGIKLGRPRVRVDTRMALELRAEGMSVREIAKRMRVPATSLARALKGNAPLDPDTRGLKGKP